MTICNVSKTTSLCITLIAMTITGCVSFVPSEDYRLHPYHDVAKSDPDRAQVVFFWQEHRWKEATLPVHQDGVMIGALKDGTYFSSPVLPGRHIFQMYLGSLHKYRAPAVLVAEVGKTYFMEISGPGMYRNWSMGLVPEDVARAQLVDLSMIEWTKRHDAGPRDAP